MRKPLLFMALASWATIVGGAIAAQTPAGGLSSASAHRVLDAALRYAREHGAPGGAIAIVDAGGAVVLFEKLDGTFPSASRISIGKAATAAAFQKPTKFFEEAINGGRTAMAALPDFYPLQGGVPLVLEGLVVGAIGVSGAASADQDQEIALAGAAELGALRAAASARWFDRESVLDAFGDEGPLVQGGAYQVRPSRRDRPGEAEVHERDTDIFYVLDGRATLVTGGRLIGERRAQPDEVRGSAIAGGESRILRRGDVVVIPRGVPHWFSEVAAPVTYFTVKVAGENS